MEALYAGLLQGILLVVILYFINKWREKSKKEKKAKELESHESTLTQDPQNKNSALYVAKNMLEKGEVNTSRKIIEGISENGSEDIETLSFLLKASTFQGDFDKAIDLFEKIENLASNTKKQLELVKVMQNDPDFNAILELFEGHRYFKQGNILKANACKRSAILKLPVLQYADLY